MGNSTPGLPDVLPGAQDVPPTVEAVRENAAMNLTILKDVNGVTNTTRLGIGEVLKQKIVPTALTALTIAGVAYLTWVGLKMILTGKNELPFFKAQ